MDDQAEGDRPGGEGDVTRPAEEKRGIRVYNTTGAPGIPSAPVAIDYPSALPIGITDCRCLCHCPISDCPLPMRYSPSSLNM